MVMEHLHLSSLEAIQPVQTDFQPPVSLQHEIKSPREKALTLREKMEHTTIGLISNAIQAVICLWYVYHSKSTPSKQVQFTMKIN